MKSRSHATILRYSTPVSFKMWFFRSFSLVVPFNELTPESALYWRCLAEHLNKEHTDDNDELAEKIIPVVSTFANYIHE